MPIVNLDTTNTIQYGGQIFYSSIEGQVHFNFWQDLANDLLPVVTASTFNRIGFWNYVQPIIKINSYPENLGFVSYPEPRRKFGSYSYSNFLTIETDSEGNIITSPISKEPDFIVYEQQQLKDVCIGIVYPEPVASDYEIIYAPAVESLSQKLLLSRRRNASSYASFMSASGMYLNLPPGVNADLLIYYEGAGAGVTNSETRTIFISPV